MPVKEIQSMVDIDGLLDIAVGFEIRALPTFHAYKNGERIEAMVGADRAGLEAVIQNSVARA
ncbi:hypothetical protein L210DRAFT_3648382 [Boletus edulis BED1]|uniref:Thioredoxin domain-containing protein n=1 Tax=Boletus edulis BED1 TaxID=1328754 RepID=A0AAD4BP23_BOLED|nr:hypothetical protein L210DRAFT_3648382 [Boletus edulis BED1]